MKAAGSSRLMVWPAFGMTTSAAVGMVRFIRMPGLETGPILVAGHDQRRHGDGLHLVDQVEQRRPPLLHAAHGARRAFGRMLRELIGEFAPAARVLVLELHARRPERVTFGGLGHAQLFEILGGGLGFFGELCRAYRASRRSRSRPPPASERAPDR